MEINACLPLFYLLGFTILSIQGSTVCPENGKRITVFKRFTRCPPERPRCCNKFDERSGHSSSSLSMVPSTDHSNDFPACCPASVNETHSTYLVFGLISVFLMALSLAFCSDSKDDDNQSLPDGADEVEGKPPSFPRSPRRSRQRSRSPPEEFPPHMPKKLELPGGNSSSPPRTLKAVSTAESDVTPMSTNPMWTSNMDKSMIRSGTSSVSSSMSTARPTELYVGGPKQYKPNKRWTSPPAASTLESKVSRAGSPNSSKVSMVSSRSKISAKSSRPASRAGSDDSPL